MRQLQISRQQRAASRSSSAAVIGEDVATMPMRSPGMSGRGFTSSMRQLNHHGQTPGRLRLR